MISGLPDPPDVVAKKLLDELHDRFGICNHCGQRNCPGRKQWSRLPETLKTDDVLAALRLATIPEGVVVVTWQSECCPDPKVKTITCVCGTVDDLDLS